MATTTLGRRHPYIPWLLCTLRAHARARGSCLLEATTAPPTYRGNSSGLRSNGPVDGGRISKRGIASVLLIYASQVWSCAHACTMRATQRETKRDKGAVLAQTTMKTTNVFRKVGQQGDTTIDGYKKSSCTYIDTSKQQASAVLQKFSQETHTTISGVESTHAPHTAYPDLSKRPCTSYVCRNTRQSAVRTWTTQTKHHA